MLERHNRAGESPPAYTATGENKMTKRTLKLGRDMIEIDISDNAERSEDLMGWPYSPAFIRQRLERLNEEGRTLLDRRIYRMDTIDRMKRNLIRQIVSASGLYGQRLGENLRSQLWDMNLRGLTVELRGREQAKGWS